MTSKLLQEDKNTILIFLPNYQGNHESYYNVLINKVFKNKNIIFLAYTFKQNVISNNENVTFYYPKTNESLNGFTLKNIKLFIRADLIVFEELYKISFLLPIILVSFGYKTLLSIHNVNKWLRRETKKEKNFIVEIIIKAITKNIKGIIVISLSLKDYIIDNKLIEKQVYYLPFIDMDIVSSKKKADTRAEVTFTIPGTINTERRDYKSFLKAILWMLENSNEKGIKLVLLGKKVKIGNEEYDLINRINNIKIGTVKYWDEFIDDSTFEKEILKSNYLIGNINVEYKENLIHETYGQSKETGVLFLMLKYNIQTFFPAQYKSNDIYRDLIIKYINKKELIIDLIEKAIINKRDFKKGNQNLLKHKKIVQDEIALINKIF